MLFRFARKKPRPLQPVLHDQRVYAVGDIHGRLDRFSELLDMIRNDCDTGRRPSRIDLVLLGDYIDRGRDSAAMLDLLTQLELPGVKLTLLRGNHEQVMLDVMTQPRAQIMEQWLSFGGQETLSSYGLSSRQLYSNDAGDIWTAMQSVIPAAHMQLLDSLQLTCRIGDYFFVHAGVRPRRDLDTQDPRDLMWIREPFLSSDDDFGAVVVHGHSICRTVENRANRIGIDTGAYVTGVLTAVVLEADQRRFLATGPAA